ncbi:immunity 53 family protein [uncultured Lamprocystis sp.]|jgi:hypothetical protein|uniref:immunity 53 family protein n=1 Tax=uncultured Lamprocystis sp. TaxID=543132 RepID=UPI0034453326
MNALAQLQDWYLSQCNGDWEHTYGVSIGTLDNPGWSLVVELTDSNLDGRSFAPVSHGVGADSVEDDPDWLTCEVKSNRFVAHGGPLKLDEMIMVFVKWADSCPPNAGDGAPFS